MVALVRITERQMGALEAGGRRRFAADLRGWLTALPETAQAAQARPQAWFDWVVERAAFHRIADQVDTLEFAAQLLVHGDALLDDPHARRGLDHPDNPGWLRIRHFARFRLILDREV